VLAQPAKITQWRSAFDRSDFFLGVPSRTFSRCCLGVSAAAGRGPLGDPPPDSGTVQPPSPTDSPDPADSADLRLPFRRRSALADLNHDFSKM
jgi:hypothetical protein